MKQYTSRDELYSMHTDLRNTENTIVRHELHNHNQYEFFYLKHGNVEYNIECENYTLSDGDVVIVNYHEYHALKILNPDDYDRIVIQMDEFFLSNMLLELDVFSFFRGKLVGQNNKISAKVVKQYKLDKLFVKLSDLTADTPENDLLIKCTMIEILLILTRVHESANARPVMKQSNHIKNVVQFIHNNIDKELTLDIIANQFFLTKYYLCHEFKKHIGIPINEYIITKRILLANSLIKRGMPAIEACYATKFNNYSNFYRSFKKILGQSPTNMLSKYGSKGVDMSKQNK